MEYSFLFEFGLILVIATLLGIIAKILKQPLILAYLIAGILIGPFVLGLVKNMDVIRSFSTIGIVLLLFLVGLELNPRRLLEIGIPAIIIGLAQVTISGLIYYLIGIKSGFSSVSMIYIAIALTFSSTAIIVTILSNKKDLENFHGKILVGILLVQDFIAVVMLTILSGLKIENATTLLHSPLLTIIFKAIILFTFVFLVAKYIIPTLFSIISRSYELLFITSIAWCFLLAIISQSLGFSAEIGAFLAGIALAPLPYNNQLISKTKPLRDFFLMIFFINLGSNLIFDQIQHTILISLPFILAILIINPLIVMVIMALLGYRKRISFLVATSLTQISEFSYLIVALGVKLGYLPDTATSMISIIFIATIFISTYFITFNRKIFHYVRPLLGNFERKNTRDNLENIPTDINGHIILVGCHRMGEYILESLLKLKEKIIVVDFNSSKINELIAAGIPCIYGDGIDHDLIEKLAVPKAKMVISTIDNFEEGSILIDLYRSHNKKIQVILTAHNEEDGLNLYKQGADFVIVPSTISGEYAGFVLKKIEEGKTDFRKIRKQEIRALEQDLKGTLGVKSLKVDED